MVSDNSIARWRDYIQESLVGNRIFSSIVGTFSGKYVRLFVEKTETGYRKEFQDYSIELKKASHFTDMVTHNPLKGYFDRIEIKEEDHVIDAGSFPGEFAVVAAKKGATVTALEPDPENADMLRENLKLNGVEDRVKVVEKGLWKEKDRKNFHRDSALGMASRIDESSEITIQLDDLDSIAEEHGNPDLVKMDIEGAEIKALEGAEEILEKVRPVFEIATYHFMEGRKRTYGEVEQLLESNDYEVDTGYSKHLTTYGFPD